MIDRCVNKKKTLLATFTYDVLKLADRGGGGEENLLDRVVDAAEVDAGVERERLREVAEHFDGAGVDSLDERWCAPPTGQRGPRVFRDVLMEGFAAAFGERVAQVADQIAPRELARPDAGEAVVCRIRTAVVARVLADGEEVILAPDLR